MVEQHVQTTLFQLKSVRNDEGNGNYTNAFIHYFPQNEKLAVFSGLLYQSAPIFDTENESSSCTQWTTDRKYHTERFSFPDEYHSMSRFTKEKK